MRPCNLLSRLASLLVAAAVALPSSTAATSSSLLELHNLVRRASAGSGAPNASLVDTARMGLLSSQRASWEQGTAQSALLEYDAGSWSVFAGGHGNGPPYRPGFQPSETPDGVPLAVLSMAYHSATAQDGMGKLGMSITGDENMTDGSALDSASCGDGVLLAAFVAKQINATRGFWINAAQDQLDYVLNEAPRTEAGAISHRTRTVALWSDAVYMMPPFLAAYGLYTNNQSLLQTAYDQIRLYRQAMRFPDGPGEGLWGHILAYNANGTARWLDGQAWTTGEGWVAAGMLRTLASIAQSPYSTQMASQKADLVAWTKEILDASFPLLDSSSSLFHNYMNDTTTFRDTAGSTFLAYAAYRLASMSPSDDTHLAGAEKIYQATQGQLTRIGSYLTPVVNALDFGAQGSTSPEALSFTMLLEAARRDYHAGNVTGVDGPGTGRNGAMPGIKGGVAAPVLVAAVTATLLLLLS